MSMHPAAYWPGYYPGGLYVPDPWQTTWVSKHFPEHHYPLEHTRHAIGRAITDIAHDFNHSWVSEHSMICPRNDVRESVTTYYIDVELPGVADEKEMTLKWLGSRTLLLKVTVTRAPTPEDGLPLKKTEEDTSGTAKDEAAHPDKKHEKQGEKPADEAQSVYLTLGERRVGTYGRAFNFPVDVDHDATTAKLHAGLLRLTVPKLAADSKIDKKVSVQTGERHETSSQGVGAPEVSK